MRDALGIARGCRGYIARAQKCTNVLALANVQLQQRALVKVSHLSWSHAHTFTCTTDLHDVTVVECRLEVTALRQVLRRKWMMHERQVRSLRHRC